MLQNIFSDIINGARAREPESYGRRAGIFSTCLRADGFFSMFNEWPASLSAIVCCPARSRGWQRFREILEIARMS